MYSSCNVVAIGDQRTNDSERQPHTTTSAKSPRDTRCSLTNITSHWQTPQVSNMTPLPKVQTSQNMHCHTPAREPCYSQTLTRGYAPRDYEALQDPHPPDHAITAKTVHMKRASNKTACSGQRDSNIRHAPAVPCSLRQQIPLRDAAALSTATTPPPQQTTSRLMRSTCAIKRTTAVVAPASLVSQSASHSDINHTTTHRQ